MGSIVEVTQLKKIKNSNGDVWHALKSSESNYVGFGEAYFSWVMPGSIKGWKRHNEMTMNIVVPLGNVRFVFFTDSKKEFQVEEIGEIRYVRLTIPPGIWFGFKGISSTPSIVMNIASIEHDPLEVDRLNLQDLEFNWS
jgi:dTDP-4-dehydrorhamnose 3,5-epimerase